MREYTGSLRRITPPSATKKGKSGCGRIRSIGRASSAQTQGAFVALVAGEKGTASIRAKIVDRLAEMLLAPLIPP